MIDLTIDPKTRFYRDALRGLGASRLRPLGLECDRRGEPLPPDHPFFREMVEMGFTGGLAGPLEEQAEPLRDGAGRVRTRARRTVVLAEEAAYWDRGMATSLPGPGLGAPPVVLMGTPEQRARFLGVFEDRSRPHWAAFAMSEPGAGSDVAAIRTRVRRDGDGYVIDGQKMFCSNGARASWVVVFATVDPSLGRAGHRALVVERGTPGMRVLRIEHKMGLNASETAALAFEDCRVPAENLLGGEASYEARGAGAGAGAGGAGFKGAMRTFDATRPIVGAMAVGIGRAAYDEAARFAQGHYALGRPVPRYRAVREKLARMRRKLEVGRLLCWRAAWLADMGQPNTVEASMAKAYCAPAGLEACSLAMEILGDAGAAADALVEKFFRDVKVLDIVEGTAQIQRVVLARRLVNYPGAESH